MSWFTGVRYDTGLQNNMEKKKKPLNADGIPQPGVMRVKSDQRDPPASWRKRRDKVEGASRNLGR